MLHVEVHRDGVIWRQSYRDGVTDEFVVPTRLGDWGTGNLRLQPQDEGIFFNFRSDRARQLTQALTETDFEGFDRVHIPGIPMAMTTMTRYEDDLPVTVDRRLRHGDRLAVDDAGTVALEVIALRGHTPGSVALAYTEDASGPQPGRVHLFVGDSLFPGGVGKTAGPQEFTSLLDDVEQRVFAVYPDDSVVWPGHGLPTTLGAERPHLAKWRRRGW